MNETRREFLQAATAGLAIARSFKPMTAAELERQVTDSADAGNGGRYERFKTMTQFDGRCHRVQHGV